MVAGGVRRRPWLLAPVVVLCACAYDRPIHPLRLEGFPGAPIEGDLFPLREGAKWEFDDRKTKQKDVLTLEIVREGDDLVLTGTEEGRAVIRVRNGFVEVVFGDRVAERLLKLEGSVGERWKGAGARYTVFGYDRLEVLGKTVRALVVAAERGQKRDLFWFAPGIGPVRVRTEQQGAVKRDAVLKAFRPGRTN